MLAFVVITLLIHSVRAQGGVDRLFDEANLLYQQQDYEGALDKYRQIEMEDQESSALYYNLGNCYYKLGNVGKSVLYYERALRLDPGDDDIEANLVVANQATVDKIIPPAQFAAARTLQRLLYVFSFSSLTTIATMLYLGVGILFTISLILRGRRKERLLRRSAFLVMVALLVMLALGTAQWLDARIRIEGVVQQNEVTVRGAPDSSGVELFQIHEGTKVRIDQSTDSWIEIVLVDGKVGWVPRESVEII
jgi:tetratricopeptide (TPR) repeat protein